MNSTDFLVLASVAVLVPALLIKNVYVRSICVPISTMTLIVGHMWDVTLANSVIISVIAGSLMQTVLTDPFLVRRTLKYQENARTILKTPLWMVALWGVALTQLFYLYFRIHEVFGSGIAPTAAFVMIGWSYFYVFELVVNNWTKWWTRHDCYQPLNVAAYAMAAELVAVVFIPLSAHIFQLLQENHLRASSAIMVSWIYGLMVAMSFICLCSFSYRLHHALEKRRREAVAKVPLKRNQLPYSEND